MKDAQDTQGEKRNTGGRPTLANNRLRVELPDGLKAKVMARIPKPLNLKDVVVDYLRRIASDDPKIRIKINPKP